jgi:hypothetical protein
MNEDASELTAELVTDGVVLSQPVISPDGCWVTYIVAPASRRAEQRTRALWLAAADGSSPPVKSSTRVRDTGSPSVTISSTCSGARAHGSTGGFVMKHPAAFDLESGGGYVRRAMVR